MPGARAPAYTQTVGRRASAIALVMLGAAACGGARGSGGDRVFYAAGTLPTPGEPSPVELAAPPLDRPADASSSVALRGVEIAGGGIRFARPTSWTIRGGSAEAPARYVQYVSPRAMLIGVYERAEPSGAEWADVLKRYEADVAAARSTIVAGPVPFAAGNAQGRAYHLRHRVAATGAPFTNESREVVLRAHGRVILVQVVYSGELLPLADELLPFFASFELR